MLMKLTRSPSDLTPTLAKSRGIPEPSQKPASSSRLASREITRSSVARASTTAFRCAPDRREVAAIGVPNELSEEDVLVVVAPTDGRTIDPAELLEFLRPRMAHFMLPRYVRVLPELPKTPSSKVMKHELRVQGVTADTWDRERAGIKLQRDQL